MLWRKDSMRLLLVRHGNTFGSADKVVWVGARTDLSLVEKGRDQARAVGRALNGVSSRPRAIFSGPLRRTRETAEIIANEIGFPLSEIAGDACLRELDYGKWEGKSSQEIAIAFGPDGLREWEDNTRWPHDAEWSPAESEVKENLKRLAQQLMLDYRDGDDIVLVSSNGIFRMMAREFVPSLQKNKMATGSISVLTLDEAGKAADVHWNISPEQLSLAYQAK
jgi:broad specificity phosphatase PhoE